jgi:hypothetical protein
LRIRRIVERWPSLSSSPSTLRYPQFGFSVAIRTTCGCPKPLHMSRDVPIFVEEAADAVASLDLA